MQDLCEQQEETPMQAQSLQKLKSLWQHFYEDHSIQILENVTCPLPQQGSKSYPTAVGTTSVYSTSSLQCELMNCYIV